MTIDKTGKWWVGTQPADVAEYLGQTMTANLPRPQFVEPQRLLIQAAKSQQCCKDDQKAKMNHSCRRVDTA